ncbi:MAG: isoaspartyl peptidase/L-asparaginase family protein [Rhodothermales bacterium]
MRTLHSGSTGAPGGLDGVCLLVHGGAWNIPQEESGAHLDGLQQALDLGRTLLLAGTSALEVVTETVAVMEAHGAFDAGRGAVLTRSGTVELDAGLMDGETLAFGAVAGVRRLDHPVRVARRLLERGRGQVRLMIGEGAERFAEAEGFALIDNATLICDRERRRFEHLQREAAQFHTSHPFLTGEERMPRGTVGCVARDRQGRLAAATSTGGTPFRPLGRVGDSPLPGCGFYASEHAAASATGWGEAIATMLLCGRTVDSVEAGSTPEEAVRLRLRDMYRRVQNREGNGATGGLIVLDRHGNGAWAFTTPRMARGAWYEGGEIRVDI